MRGQADAPIGAIVSSPLQSRASTTLYDERSRLRDQ
jgi:hypothetical protein